MPSYQGFIGGSSPSLSAIATSERTVNFYVEQIGTEGRQHKTALYPTPGQQAWITAANSLGVLVDVGGRGGIGTGSRAFAVVGGGYYEHFADATFRRLASCRQDVYVDALRYHRLTAGERVVGKGRNPY